MNKEELEFILQEGEGYKIEFKEVLEIPEEALRESVLNAIVHRDYFESGTGIFVEMFDDRVEIYNKGKLLFDKRLLGRLSVPRNPILFDLFYRKGLIEKIGSGINRIRQLARERGLRIKFETNGFFRVVYKRAEMTPQKTPQKTTELEQKIFDLIKENPKMTRKEIAKKLNFSTDTVKEYLQKLKGKGLLARVGGRKYGYWKILIKENKKEDENEYE